jgi:SHS family lactate transporter-like MFS transporter
MAMVLEAVPRRSRGLVAGFTQQGFSSGYLLASGLHLALSESTPFLEINHYG